MNKIGLKIQDSMSFGKVTRMLSDSHTINSLTVSLLLLNIFLNINFKKFNIILTKEYYQNFSIIQQASYFAHYSALNELSKSSLNFEPKPSEDSVEFEISDDLVEFYRESRKFKKEKKEIEKSRLKGLTDGTIKEHISGEQGTIFLLSF